MWSFSIAGESLLESFKEWRVCRLLFVSKNPELVSDYVECMLELSSVVHVMNARSSKSAAADDTDGSLRAGVVIQNLTSSKSQRSAH